MSSSNTYFVVPYGSREPISWDPHNAKDLPTHDSAYFGAVLSAMDRQLLKRGLTFYLTPDIERLPSMDKRTVAIVTGDEWARYPRYAFDILATFKCYGTSLASGLRYGKPRYLDLLGALQTTRMSLKRLPTVARYNMGRGRGRTAHIFPIPLGYFRQVLQPFIPIDDRIYDVSFNGSIQQGVHGKLSWKTWLQSQSPKSFARREMLRSLELIAERYDEFVICTETKAGFFNGSIAQALEYSKTLMSTKVCVVPRGTSLETFRYFEALRFGCVVICEVLPNHWYYAGSPAIEIRDWSELEDVLVPLLRDSAVLNDLSQKAITWWQDHVGETAVGRYIAEKLNAI